MVLCLVKLFNSIVSLGKIAESWKQGFIVPLYKRGDKPKKKQQKTKKTPCDNYRPVAVLSCFKKTPEDPG
jgi:hypothetical protein